MFIFSKNHHLHEKIILLNKHDLHKSKGAQKITNLGKLPSEQKRKIPKRQKKIKIIKENSQVKKENSQALKLLKYDNIF